MTTYADIKIDQGSSFKILVELEHFESENFSLSDYEISGGLKRSPGSQDVTEFSIDVDDESPFEFTFGLSPEVTSNLRTDKRYHYMVELSSENGETVERILEGYAEINPSVFIQNPI